VLPAKGPEALWTPHLFAAECGAVPVPHSAAKRGGLGGIIPPSGDSGCIKFIFRRMCNNQV